MQGQTTATLLRCYFCGTRWSNRHRLLQVRVNPGARGKTTRKPFGKIHPMPIPSRPWEETALDSITGLPQSSSQARDGGLDLVVTCVFSKHVHPSLFIKLFCRDIAQVYFDGIYKHHGAQRAITSDRTPS